MIRHSGHVTFPATRVRPSGVDKQNRVIPNWTCWRCGIDLPHVYREGRSGLCVDCRPHAKTYTERNHP